MKAAVLALLALCAVALAQSSPSGSSSKYTLTALTDFSCGECLNAVQTIKRASASLGAASVGVTVVPMSVPSNRASFPLAVSVFAITALVPSASRSDVLWAYIDVLAQKGAVFANANLRALNDNQMWALIAAAVAQVAPATNSSFLAAVAEGTPAWTAASAAFGATCASASASGGLVVDLSGRPVAAPMSLSQAAWASMLAAAQLRVGETSSVAVALVPLFLIIALTAGGVYGLMEMRKRIIANEWDDVGVVRSSAPHADADFEEMRGGGGRGNLLAGGDDDDDI
eukprot:c17451_g1_i1.p3 GENE.c17451_g1_i1~~c17451_g1_i1.p3  ORF type:complete len:285 (+),score=54.78 c17451_g1_i1:134-988(+)